MLVAVDQPGYGTAYLAGNPVKLSRTPCEQFAPIPALGEHTTEVLMGLLGYSREKVDRMLEEGAAEEHRPPRRPADEAAAGCQGREKLMLPLPLVDGTIGGRLFPLLSGELRRDGVGLPVREKP
jgi:hypothetical protein